MSVTEAHSLLHVAPGKQAVFRELGLDAEGIFEHPGIKAWRVLADRENCTLTTDLANGERVRWHIKRYASSVAGTTAAEIEVAGNSAAGAGGDSDSGLGGVWESWQMDARF